MAIADLRPAFLAGAAIGALSGLPVVNAGNCCCCLWVVGGGAFAAYLLQQRRASPVELGEAAIEGLIAGAVGAVVSSLIALPFSMMAGAMDYGSALDEILSRQPDLSPEARQFAERFRGYLSGGGAGLTLGAMGFVFTLVTFTVMGTLGGLLGGAIFKKKAPAMQPPPPPPFMA